jgi:hypothetical protein
MRRRWSTHSTYLTSGYNLAAAIRVHDIFERAAEAAEGINDYTLAAWARRKAAGLRAGDASG